MGSSFTLFEVEDGGLTGEDDLGGGRYGNDASAALYLTAHTRTYARQVASTAIKDDCVPSLFLPVSLKHLHSLAPSRHM